MGVVAEYFDHRHFTGHREIVINHFFGKAAKRLNAVSPFVSVVFIILIVGYILSQNRESIMENWRVLVAAVLLLHVGGFGLGYGLARLFRFDEQSSRTVSIEVGMQNSGLGTALATKHCSVAAGAGSVRYQCRYSLYSGQYCSRFLAY